jgi:hypothetical protein
VADDGAPIARTNPERRRQFSVGGFEVDYFIWIVCTDRGQHEPVLLTTARRELDGTRGMNHALNFFAPPDVEATERSGSALGAYVFRCPKCPRTPQIKADRWWQLLDEPVRADADRLDISLLS